MSSSSAVKGVLLDAAVLRGAVADEKLLYRLRFSNLQLGVLQAEAQVQKTKEDWGLWDGVKLVVVGEKEEEEEALEAIQRQWEVPASSSVFVTTAAAAAGGASEEDKLLLEDKLKEKGWRSLVVLGGSSSSSSAGEDVLLQLEDLFLALARLNKKALGDGGDKLVVVGHSMKWSREKDFLKRGALPFVPLPQQTITANRASLSFIPIQLDRPVEPQLAAVDLVLHKPTDEIVSIAQNPTATVAERITFSEGVQKLQRYLEANPQLPVVDPIQNIMPLLDRAATRNLLEDLGDARVSSRTVVRAPRSVEVKNLEHPQQLEEALLHVSFPTIVKPLMACGASEAHTMAVVFKKEGYEGLQVPMPAVIQEYVDHGSCVYKFYVLGNKVMHSCRRSMPNAASLAVSSGSSNSEISALVFDSLKSLPVSFTAAGESSKNPQATAAANQVVEGDGSLDVEAVEAAAAWLRTKLGLTIIGFDIVVQVGTLDHVMVDVNFFPSFRDVPDVEAIPAFWSALLNAHKAKTLQTI
jgi:hypothetical protein